jgi:hypothetical protein
MTMEHCLHEIFKLMADDEDMSVLRRCVQMILVRREEDYDAMDTSPTTIERL